MDWQRSAFRLRRARSCSPVRIPSTVKRRANRWLSRIRQNGEVDGAQFYLSHTTIGILGPRAPLAFRCSPDLRCSVAQVIRLTKVYLTYDEYKTVNTKVPKAKVYPREILQAFKELEAIQPPPGFAEYQQRVKRADKKFEDACKRHGLDSLRVIMDFRLS
jgi:hypothetical protein